MKLIPNFSVEWHENPLAPAGISLRFNGTREETIIIKNVRFLPKSNNSKITEIHSVILGSKPVVRFFEFPALNVAYEAIYFDIKQDNELGWEVQVDIKTKNIFIKQADFQIM